MAWAAATAGVLIAESSVTMRRLPRLSICGMDSSQLGGGGGGGGGYFLKDTYLTNPL